MTSAHKHYQNYSFKDLISFSENNINKHKTLTPIETIHINETTETSLDTLGLKGYSAYNLNPTGIMSLITCINDPILYSLSTKGIRLQQIIEQTTILQEQTETLKNTPISRKRRKIHDLIAASYNGTHFEDKDYIDLFHGISVLCNTHFILMKSSVNDDIEDGTTHNNSIKGEIIFSSDPVNWKRENTIWIADYRARWVAIPSENHSINIHTILANWLSSIEDKGWIVQWHDINATKTEIVEQLSLLPTWKDTDKKLSKDILSFRLGRANTLRLFTKWSSNIED